MSWCLKDNDLANDDSERASDECTLEEEESDKENEGKKETEDPEEYYKNYYANNHTVPPKSTSKPPAKKKSLTPAKSKTSTDDTDPSTLINNLTLNGPPLPEYRDWLNQHLFPFLVKPTDLITGSKNFIVDFCIASVHGNKIAKDVAYDGWFLTLVSILPANIQTDHIVQ